MLGVRKDNRTIVTVRCVAGTIRPHREPHMRLLPFIAFWVLLVAGWCLREFDLKAALIFIGLWLAGGWGFPLVGLHPAWFVILVVVLDVVMVFKIFRGDVRIR